jgi:hypothetical protein
MAGYEKGDGFIHNTEAQNYRLNFKVAQVNGMRNKEIRRHEVLQ